MATETNGIENWSDWVKVSIVDGANPSNIAQTMKDAGFQLNDIIAFIEKIKDDPVNLRKLDNPNFRSNSDVKYVYNTPRIQQTGNIIKTSDRDVKVLLRLKEPVIVLLDNFMSEEECDTLIKLTDGRIDRSRVSAADGSDVIDDYRTSYGAGFSRSENEFIDMLDKRTSELMNWPTSRAEGIQVMHYKVGCEYRSHMDYFSAETAGPAGNRVSTLVMYLNEVEDGGSTFFPTLNLSVIPKKGGAAYFEYCNDAGQLDPESIHAGSPVISGEKWIATKWMRERDF